MTSSYGGELHGHITRAGVEGLVLWRAGYRARDSQNYADCLLWLAYRKLRKAGADLKQHPRQSTFAQLAMASARRAVFELDPDWLWSNGALGYVLLHERRCWDEAGCQGRSRFSLGLNPNGAEVWWTLCPEDL